jgi:hypothetical protein
MILDRLSIFSESGRGGSGVGIAMRIKSSISSRRMDVCAVNLWIGEIRMSGPESGEERERERNRSGRWIGDVLKE